MEAERVRLLLASRGIEATIPDSITASLVPYTFATKAGVRVQVDDLVADDARSIIEENRPPKSESEGTGMVFTIVGLMAIGAIITVLIALIYRY